MGHDGPGHVAIAQERPTLRALKLFHGKRGAGLWVEFKVRYGPITILGCTQTADGALKLVAAEGESIPGDDVQDRQHEHTPALRARRRPSSSSAGAPRARPTTSRSASAIVAAEVRRVASLLDLDLRRGGLSMERVCFLLQVRPDRLDEYRARHREVWPEMLDALRDGRLGQLLALPARRRAARRLRRDRRLRGGAARRWRPPTSTRAGRRTWPRSSTREADRRARAPRGGLPPCLTPALRRDRSRRRERPRRRRAPRRRARRARGGPPLRQPAGAAARRAALERRCTCSRSRSTGCARAGALPASASTPGGSTTACSTTAAACSACPSTTATRAPPAWSSARSRASPADELYAVDRHPDDADQHRLPAARRRGLARAGAAARGSRSSRTCSPSGSAASWPTSAPRRDDRAARRAHGRVGARAHRAARACRRACSAPWSSPARRSARCSPTTASTACRSTPSPRTTPPRPSPPRRSRRRTPRSSRAGTWSLLGLELPEPCSADARATRTSPTSAASTARRGCSRT